MPLAVVTGASRGIGRAIAEELAGRGWRVALVSRDPVRLAEVERSIDTHRHGSARAFPADVRDLEQVNAAIDAARSWAGQGVELLVNNAGTGGSAGDFWDDDPTVWWECVESIVRGAYNCIRSVLPGMLSAGRGRIVAIASTTGTSANAWGDATSVAKTALIRHVENLAAATGGSGISAFALHPGVVRTDLLAGYRRDPSVAAMLDRIPDEAYSPPTVAAKAVARLASGEFDAFNGRFLDATRLDELAAHAGSLSDDALKLRLGPLP